MKKFLRGLKEDWRRINKYGFLTFCWCLIWTDVFAYAYLTTGASLSLLSYGIHLALSCLLFVLLKLDLEKKTL